MRNPSRRWFWWACAFEASLAGVALAFGPLLSVWPWRTIGWSLAGAAWGFAGTLPLLGLLVFLIKTNAAWMREILNFLDRAVRPLLGSWSFAQLALLSALAGFGEEMLFRAVIQGGCARWVGVWPALAVASLVFGAFHWVTRAYALLAALIGIYLGLLWIITDNLLAPIIAHASYDLIALIYFIRFRSGRATPNCAPV